MLYLIKLTQQKDANLILTRKCFTIGRFQPTSRDTNNNSEMYDFW